LLSIFSDIILLPYSSASYKFRTSGIFVEAITMGKIALTTPSTWMAYELEKYDLKELIINWDNLNLIQKLEEIYLNKYIREKIKFMTNDYCKFHNIANFAKILKSSI
ncbi:MAG: hypothetical protein KR126chlam6_01128, partial [Candidatus Anoxychlamydiales bacterium]|nr:hypothetical protein [Candidatus Anoxychlamydiales bacterium]